jgi:hypothetical protein
MPKIKNAIHCYWTLQIPLELWESIEWTARRRKETKPKFLHNALTDILGEIDRGAIDTTRPKNVWWGRETREWSAYTNKVLKKTLHAEAHRLGWTDSGFVIFALARRVSKYVDPENVGIEFKVKSLFMEKKG